MQTHSESTKTQTPKPKLQAKQKLYHAMRLVTWLVLGSASYTAAQTCQGGEHKREMGESLPFPRAAMGGSVGPTIQKSVHKWRTQAQHLPADAPNIVIFMFDDTGFGQPTTFGGTKKCESLSQLHAQICIITWLSTGKIETPTMDKLKKEGISYNAFHTTAMCSPTRAALITGRNHHRVGAGQIAEFANDWDGYTGVIPKTSATVAKVLSYYGYATAAFGKDHNTPVDSLGTGPYDNAPTGRGFDYFYGFLAGESSQWEPLLWENTVKVNRRHTDNYEDYHISEDIADKVLCSRV
jgi:arylsulfatase